MASVDGASASPTFRVELSSEEDASCVRLQGELDLSVVDQAEGALRWAERNGRNVIVDFSALRFMDLVGMHVILAAHQRLGHRLTLRDCSPPVHRLFELTGVADQLPLANENGHRTLGGA